MKNKMFKMSLMLLFSIFSIVKSEDEYNDWYENYNYQPYHEKYAKKANESLNEFNNLNSKPIFDLIQDRGQVLKEQEMGDEYVNDPKNYTFWKGMRYSGDNENTFQYCANNLKNQYCKNKIYPKIYHVNYTPHLDSAERFSKDMNNLNIMNLFDQAQKLGELKEVKECYDKKVKECYDFWKNALEKIR